MLRDLLLSFQNLIGDLKLVMAEANGGLKIIGAGWGRTGTSSTAAALKILGYKTYAMDQVFSDNHFAKWMKLEENVLSQNENCNKLIFKEIYDDNGYDACFNDPSCGYYQVLYKHYQCKVILTTRDFDKWYNSYYNTIFQCYKIRERFWFKLPFIHNHRFIHKFMKMCIWRKNFNLKDDKSIAKMFENKEFVKQKYNKHIDEVQKNIPKKDLLIYNVAQGWEPLCKFLNKPTPKNIPFPRKNTRSCFIENDVTKRNRTANIANIIFIIMVLSSIIGIIRWMRKNKCFHMFFKQGNI